MPTVRYRSRTFRRVFVRVPGGNAVLHYRRRKNAKAQCSQCGAYLPGVPQGTPIQIHKLPRSARRPERPFGGVLCSTCMRRTIIARVRQ